MTSKTSKQLERLESTMREAGLEAQRAGTGVRHAVVGCWIRTLQRIREEEVTSGFMCVVCHEPIAEGMVMVSCGDGAWRHVKASPACLK